MKKSLHSKKVFVDTINFYNQSAQEYSNRTFHLDLEHLYSPFLELIPEGGQILDAGCGPGRDIQNFNAKGYRTTGFDASIEMVKLAQKNTGAKVLHLSFSDVNFYQEYDGIWACASLLHLPKEELIEAFRRLSKALKSNGALYCSFKYGDGETQKGDRFFNFLNENTLAEITKEAKFIIRKVWITEDVRPDRKAEKWLNAICQKID